MNIVWQKMSDELIADGIDVYHPATHKGEVKSPYCVVKDEGGAQLGKFSTQQRYYSLYCYVPMDRYTDLQDFVEKCKTAVERLAPMVMPTGQETPSVLDPTSSSYVISVEYRCQLRNKLL